MLSQPGDTLKFWKSDRWGRSAADVLATVNELRDRGVTLVSLTENFDLATKEGRLMFGVLALAAEYELELRAERQADGIASARRRQAEGRMLPGKKHIGRPPATGPAELAALRDLVADGKSVTEARPHPQDRALHRLRRPRRQLGDLSGSADGKDFGMILPVKASGGPGVTDILTAIGTVGAVIAAVAIALWTDRRSGKEIKAERKLALEQEQEAAANAVQVALVANGPGDDHTWMLAVLVVNHSSFVITDVDARVRTPARKHLIEPAMREKVPGSHRLSPGLVQGMSARAEALADTGTLGSWDDGIRFQSASLDTGQVIGAYPVARWTDRWGGRWEYVSGKVRRIGTDEPWTPLPVLVRVSL